MKKGDKKKQQKALKRRTENRQLQKQARGQGGDSPQRHLRQARQYPIADCWVQRDWEKSGLAVVVVTRQQPDGGLIFGNYLVDTYCLGVKNTYWNADISFSEFQRDFLPKFYSAVGRPIKISPELAHEIVYGGVEYARQFGFKPHRDFAKSQLVLDLPADRSVTGKVKFGQDGKPLFVAGPHDNVDAVLRQLSRTAGEGNYHYLLPLGDPMGELLDDEDEWDDDEGVLQLAEPLLPQDLLDEIDLEIGDSVAVKSGVKDPDTGSDIGGWQGRVIDFDVSDDEAILVGLEWDSLTLKQTPAGVFEQCVKDGLDWSRFYLDLNDVERADPRDTLTDVINMQDVLGQQYGRPFDEADEHL